MKSEKAKVLHEIFYQPMVVHVINETRPLRAQQTVAVIGHQKIAVKEALREFTIDFAIQTEQLGTGHAVLSAEELVTSTIDTVMILCGDTPLIRSETLQAMFEAHCSQQCGLSLMTTLLDDPTNYGRILSDNEGNLLGIVEQKDANEEELKINEINAGIYCVDSKFLFSALKQVGTDNKQGEVYLTDIVEMAVEAKMTVKKFTAANPQEILGVNSRAELAEAQRELQLRRNRQLMANGVSMISPETIRIAPEATIETDVLIEPCVHIDGESTIGSSSVINQNSVLKNCKIGKNVTIGAGCYLENINISDQESVPPLSKETKTNQ